MWAISTPASWPTGMPSTGTSRRSSGRPRCSPRWPPRRPADGSPSGPTNRDDSVGEIQDGGAVDVAAAYVIDCLVRLFEAEGRDFRANWNLCGEGEELFAVAAAEIRNRAYDALAPEELVGKRGNVAHADARTDDDAGLPNGAQRRGDERSDGREDDRGVEFVAW